MDLQCFCVSEWQGKILIHALPYIRNRNQNSFQSALIGSA